MEKAPRLKDWREKANAWTRTSIVTSIVPILSSTFRISPTFVKRGFNPSPLSLKVLVQFGCLEFMSSKEASLSRR